VSVKINLEDLEKAVEFLKKNSMDVSSHVELDLKRLVLRASDRAGDLVTIVLFDESVKSFPKKTITSRL